MTQRSGAMWGGKGGGFGKGYGDSTLAMKTSQRIRPMVAVLLFRFTLKMNMSPKKGPFQKEISSSKPQPVVSGDVLVFGGYISRKRGVSDTTQRSFLP